MADAWLSWEEELSDHEEVSTNQSTEDEQEEAVQPSPSKDHSDDEEDYLVSCDVLEIDADGEALVPQTRVFYKKTRRGKVAQIVREHYVRTDAEEVKRALNEGLSPSASHFIMPDHVVALNFLELFEFEACPLANIVWPDTVLKEVSIVQMLSLHLLSALHLFALCTHTRARQRRAGMRMQHILWTQSDEVNKTEMHFLYVR